MKSELNQPASGPRVARPFDRDWLFCYDPSSTRDDGRARPDHNEADFAGTAIPHTWHTYETTGQVHPFIRNPSETDNPYWWYGWGWYRKHWRMDERHRGRRVFLEFDGVQKYARIYCNGVLAGEHKGGFTSFSIEVTDHLRWDEDNCVAVAVSARRDDDFGNIPPMMAGNWNLYGGIYRSVRLVVTGPVYIPFQGSADHEGGVFVTTSHVSRERAVVRIRTHVRNEDSYSRTVQVCHEIIDDGGEVVARMQAPLTIAAGTLGTVAQLSPDIRSPRLWSPSDPYLYQVRTSVSDSSGSLDGHHAPLGLRWFRWDYTDNTFWLNDEPVHIHGTNRHQEYPWLGDALPQWIHERDLDDIHGNLGHNFIRFCHYTQDASVYDYCDRHGILVCEEVPCIKNLPFGREAQRQQVVEMIRRDRNHPCIVMWSMGNETNNAADGDWAVAEDATRIIHYRHVQGLEPEGRHTHRNLDMENLLRCTVRGWPERAALTDSGAPAPQDHENGQMSGTEAWQCAMACRDGGSIRGRIDRDMVAWIYADHGADREYGDCPVKHVNPKGWVDAYRQPKYLYYLWQAHYAPRLTAFAQPHWWHRRYIGEKHDITVYSNADEVSLYIGESLFATATVEANSFHTATFRDVPIQESMLRVVGRRGEERVEHSAPLAGPPAALRLTSSHSHLPADRSGIALITVDVVDALGQSVTGACPPLNWEIDGPGKLLAPATTISDLQRHEAEEGTMYTTTPVVMPIRASNVPGSIRVRVSSPGLGAAQVTLESTAPPAIDDGVTEVAAPDGNLERQALQRRDGSVCDSTAAMPIKIIHTDLHFASREKSDIEQALRERIGAATCERHSAAVRTLLESLTVLVLEGAGTLIADDYNFHVTQFNRQLSSHAMR